MLVRLVLAGLLAGTGALGVAAANASDDTLDGKLESRVEASYTDAKLGGLDVDVKDGVVTLTGEVATKAEKARAERLARTAGARRVINRLVVDADKTAARIDDRAEAKKAGIDERAERQKEQVDRQAERAKDKLEPGNPKPDDRVVVVKDRKDVVDPWVTTKVKTKILADDLLDKSEIDVDTTNDGVVTLKGTVPSAAAETRALELARTTEGVRSVVDRLEVR